MPAFDASSILHGWINYPLPQFPKLWEWIEEEIASSKFIIPKVAIDEVGHRAPECQKWLKLKGIQELPTTQIGVMLALGMKSALGIVNDKYHPNGVDENDLLIIAAAKEVGCELISNESRQPFLPVMMAKYKIPAVCSMTDVHVPCVDFLDVIKQSGKAFG